MRLRITGRIEGRDFEHVFDDLKAFKDLNNWTVFYREVWPSRPMLGTAEDPAYVDLYSIKILED